MAAEGVCFLFGIFVVLWNPYAGFRPDPQTKETLIHEQADLE